MAINRRRRRRKKDVFEPEEFMPKQVISFTDLEESLKEDGGPSEVSEKPGKESTLKESPKNGEKGLKEKLAGFSVDEELLSFSEKDLADIPVESAFISGKYSSGKKEGKHEKSEDDLKESMKLEEFLRVGEPSEGLGFAELSTTKKVKQEILAEDSDEMGEDSEQDEEEESAFKVSMDIFSIPQTDFKSMLTDNDFQDELLSQFEEEEEKEIIPEEIVEEEVVREEVAIAEETESTEEELIAEETPVSEEATEEEVIEEAAIEPDEAAPEYTEEVVEIIEEEIPETDETPLEEVAEELIEEEVTEYIEEIPETEEHIEEGGVEVMEEVSVTEEEITEYEETAVEEEVEPEEMTMTEEESEVTAPTVEAEILHIMENKFADEIAGIRKQIGDVLIHLNTLDDIRGKMKGPVPDLKAFVEQLAEAAKVESAPEVIEIPIISVCETEEIPAEKKVAEKAPGEVKAPVMPQVKVSMEKEISVFGDLIRSVPALYFLKPGFSKAIFEPEFGYKELTGMYRLASRYLKQELVNAQRNMEIIRTQFLNYKNQGAQLDFLLGSEEKPATEAVIASPVDEGELFTLRETIKKKDNLIGRQQIQLDKMHLDFANSRARQQKDIDYKVAKFQESIIGDLLKVVDDFELSMNFAQQGSHDESLIKGFKMTFEGLKSTLKKFGLEEIPAMGEKFDPQHSRIPDERRNKSF